MAAVGGNVGIVHLHHGTNTTHGILCGAEADEGLGVRRRGDCGLAVDVVIIVTYLAQIEVRGGNLRFSVGLRVEHLLDVGKDHLLFPAGGEDNTRVGQDIGTFLLRGTTHNHGYITGVPHTAEGKDAGSLAGGRGVAVVCTGAATLDEGLDIVRREHGAAGTQAVGSGIALLGQISRDSGQTGQFGHDSLGGAGAVQARSQFEIEHPLEAQLVQVGLIDLHGDDVEHHGTVCLQGHGNQFFDFLVVICRIAHGEKATGGIVAGGGALGEGNAHFLERHHRIHAAHHHAGSRGGEIIIIFIATFFALGIKEMRRYRVHTLHHGTEIAAGVGKLHTERRDVVGDAQLLIKNIEQVEE